MRGDWHGSLTCHSHRTTPCGVGYISQAGRLVTMASSAGCGRRIPKDLAGERALTGESPPRPCTSGNRPDRSVSCPSAREIARQRLRHAGGRRPIGARSSTTRGTRHVGHRIRWSPVVAAGEPSRIDTDGAGTLFSSSGRIAGVVDAVVQALHRWQVRLARGSAGRSVSRRRAVVQIAHVPVTTQYSPVSVPVESRGNGAV